MFNESCFSYASTRAKPKKTGSLFLRKKTLSLLKQKAGQKNLTRRTMHYLKSGLVEASELRFNTPEEIGMKSLLLIFAYLFSLTGEGAQTVDYFAGKDESCLVSGPEGVIEGAKKKMEVVKGHVSQIISITDFYEGSSETHCTIALATPGKQKKKDRRFSSSHSRCSEITKLAANQKSVVLHVVKDHLCEIGEGS